jgi:hypothetical protein
MSVTLSVIRAFNASTSTRTGSLASLPIATLPSAWVCSCRPSSTSMLERLQRLSAPTLS